MYADGFNDPSKSYIEPVIKPERVLFDVFIVSYIFPSPPIFSVSSCSSDPCSAPLKILFIM